MGIFGQFCSRALRAATATALAGQGQGLPEGRQLRHHRRDGAGVLLLQGARHRPAHLEHRLHQHPDRLAPGHEAFSLQIGARSDTNSPALNILKILVDHASLVNGHVFIADCRDYFSKSLFVVGEFGGNDYNAPLFSAVPFSQVKTYVPLVAKAIANGVEVVFLNYKSNSLTSLELMMILTLHHPPFCIYIAEVVKKWCGQRFS